MDIIDKLTDLGQSLGQSVARKSGELMESSKLSMAIRNKKNEIRNSKIEIGNLIYEMYKNGADLDPEVAARCKVIDDLYEEIDEIEAEKENLGLDDLNVEVVEAEAAEVPMNEENLEISEDAEDLDDVLNRL